MWCASFSFQRITKMKQIRVEIIVLLVCSTVCLEAVPRSRNAFTDSSSIVEKDNGVSSSEKETVEVRISGKSGFATTVILSDGRSETKFSKTDIYDAHDGNRKIDVSVSDLTTDDILPSKNWQNKQDAANPSWIWSTKRIPLLYDSSLSLRAVAVIEAARVEFELQTCVYFEDWTSEVDYIEIDTSSGCSSYVGRQGGKQTLSIETGCEHLAVVEHEIMHAMGIYHEQSRPDRDEYVIIKTENIETDKLFNFNKASYYIVDKSIALYDYHSVMHYSGTAFSINGLQTIETLDPAHQDVIGQRQGFSQGDVTEMNTLYSCEQPRRYSHYCNFEEESDCGYTAEGTSFKSTWKRTVAFSTDETRSFSSTDSTFELTTNGSYMALLNEPGEANVTLSISTVRLKSTVQCQCLYFRYKTSKDSTLRVFVTNLNPVTGEELQNKTEVTSLSGNGTEYWNLERVTINASSDFKIVFEGKAQAASVSTTTPALAIDDINVLDKSCESNYFVINNYAHILNITAKEESILSNVLFTEDGYAYQILVFPQGESDAIDGYMSVFFCLARGNDDDNLEWPFINRAIKIFVVDQQPHVLNQMNENFMFLTTSETNLWGQPTSARNRCYGYRNFIRVSSLTDTRQFLKHDSIMISIDVTDMRCWSLQSDSQDTYSRLATCLSTSCNENKMTSITTASETSTLTIASTSTPADIDTSITSGSAELFSFMSLVVQFTVTVAHIVTIFEH